VIYCCPHLAMQLSQANYQLIAVTKVVDFILLPPRENRLALTLFPNGSQAYAVYLDADYHASTPSTIPVSMTPVTWTLFEHGDMVRRQWRCYNPGGSNIDVALIEVVGPEWCEYCEMAQKLRLGRYA
jgi:hypothetical protein